MSSLFSVSDVFVTSKMMLFALLIMMLFTYVCSDVVLAHCAEGATSLMQ